MQSTLYLWWAQGQWDRLVSEYIRFPQSVPISTNPPILHYHISIDNEAIILQTDRNGNKTLQELHSETVYIIFSYSLKFSLNITLYVYAKNSEVLISIQS